MENVPNEMICSCCKSGYLETDKFCGNCSFPFQGTPEEQKQFRISYSFNDIDRDLVQKRIREARIILFVIAGFTFIQSLLLYAGDTGLPLFIINLIICGIYAGLGFWAKNKPFEAILTGGLIYISIIILSAFLEPSSIAKGIILKIIFITAFIRASYGAHKFRISKI